MTTVRILEETAARSPDATAFHHRADGQWRETSWASYRQSVFQVGKALVALGIEPGTTVVIIGSNRPEWFIAYLGAMAAGAVPAGVYTTSTASQCRYIVEHSEAAIAFVEDEEQLAKFVGLLGGSSTLNHIVMMNGTSGTVGVWSWSQLLDEGAEAGNSEIDRRSSLVGEEDLATLIYTSGTTGPPKAVMLSHRNLMWTAATIAEVLDLGSEDRMLSYLPLSHIAEQILVLHTPLRSRTPIWFVGDPSDVAEAMAEVRPTLFFGVPRVWEKIAAKVRAAGRNAPPWRRALIRWARRVGLDGGYADQERRPRPLTYALAERLVFRKVRRKLGLDRARLCVTSAAPIALDTLEFFLSLGVPLDEVYGMSECSGPTTMSFPGKRRIGAAGAIAAGTEMRTREDGEILIRGPHVFMGYYKDPEGTAATLDEEGWLHSGDVGEIDAEGFLTITDRKKDLIITAGGHNVSPANIEKQLETIPGVSQAAVVGDRRHYLVALLTVDREALADLAPAVGSGAVDAQTARQCPRLRRFLSEKIDEINQNLARSETIKKFDLLDNDFGIETGELTPTMKLRRNVILDKHAVQIEQLYGEG